MEYLTSVQKAPDIRVGTATSFLNSSMTVDVSDMQTTATTVMTRSFAKKVCIYIFGCTYVCWLVQRIDRKVWISPLMAQELRNIVESSEILKYVLIMILS